MAFLGVILALNSRSKRYRERYAHRRYLTDSNDVWHISDELFIKHFRLSKQSVKSLIQQLQPHVESRARWAIPFHLQVLAALNFFGHGCFQSAVGSSYLNNMSQSSVSRCIKTVTDLILKHVAPKYISFPMTTMQKMETKKQFYNKYGMSGIIGCLDCTHINITVPQKDHPENPAVLFLNKKGSYSLNVEVICDADERVIFASTTYGGSASDAAIWQKSPIRALLHKNAEDETYIIGDSSYPSEKYLLTPYRTPKNPTEENYNKCLQKTRQVMDRTLGAIKNRFRCLHPQKILHYTPDVAGKIVYAVFTLHNICREHDDPIDCVLEEDDNADDAFDGVEDVSVRNNYARRYFQQ
ncbi:putative nuclease HARBI1 [Ctenocephalides felis]|uniref:putative nuclease HARBI1 n=1 Tax=Ctenocephalides felis TaxID=7515 RepID=UPI000E6E2BAD|nr:putative nuclease HARBI1 [Ctenocephalides felis]